MSHYRTLQTTRRVPVLAEQVRLGSSDPQTLGLLPPPGHTNSSIYRLRLSLCQITRPAAGSGIYLNALEELGSVSTLELCRYDDQL